MAKAKSGPLFISFAPNGVCAGIGTIGDYLFKFESQLALRYRLVDGVVTDRYEGFTDEEVLAKVIEENEADAAEAEAARPYTIFKTTVIGRMTDEELATFDTGYKAQDLRGRMMWDNCTSIISTDPYGATLRELLTAAYGEPRAKELMAPIGT